jgi:hypothetical protein
VSINKGSDDTTSTSIILYTHCETISEAVVTLNIKLFIGIPFASRTNMIIII